VPYVQLYTFKGSFLSSVLLKAVKKIISFWIFEIIWALLQNMRNESLLVLRRQERIIMNTENPRSVFVHIRRTRRIRKIFRQNLALRICWLRGMNLFVYWEYVEGICLDIDKYVEWTCIHTENTQNAWKVKYLIEFEKKLKIFYDVYHRPRWVCLVKPL
jgi:hypothetical protein